jgi:phage terminase large subunit-like protein
VFVTTAPGRCRRCASCSSASKTALQELRIRHHGTDLGCQELLGELIEDVEGALWTRELLKQTRLAEAPE